MMAWTLVAALLLASPSAGAESPSWEQVVFVPPELRAQLDAKILQQTRMPHERARRIVEFMLSPEGLALEYDAASTLTVAEAFDVRRGNCLTLTLAFVTLAREAGLDAYVQETDQQLVQLRGETMVLYSGHVNVGVRIHSRRYVIDFDRSIIATSEPPRKITDRRALAHFYNNRGAEWMTVNDLTVARSYLEAAIALQPDFVPAWNNLGVLELRSGDARAAERAYLAALERKWAYVPTLSNLTGLYRQSGEEKKLTEYQRRLDKVQRLDPFKNFILGQQHEHQGDNAQALGYYQRAVRLHHDEPQFHFALARIYERLGDHVRAERSLERARKSNEGGRTSTILGYRAPQ